MEECGIAMVAYMHLLFWKLQVAIFRDCLFDALQLISGNVDSSVFI